MRRCNGPVCWRIPLSALIAASYPVRRRSSVNHAWTLISITGRRQYGGNLGYTEDPQQTYRYDSDVPNHLNVSVGDLVS